MPKPPPAYLDAHDAAWSDRIAAEVVRSLGLTEMAGTFDATPPLPARPQGAQRANHADAAPDAGQRAGFARFAGAVEILQSARPRVQPAAASPAHARAATPVAARRRIVPVLPARTKAELLGLARAAYTTDPKDINCLGRALAVLMLDQQGYRGEAQLLDQATALARRATRQWNRDRVDAQRFEAGIEPTLGAPAAIVRYGEGSIRMTGGRAEGVGHRPRRAALILPVRSSDQQGAQELHLRIVDPWESGVPGRALTEPQRRRFMPTIPEWSRRGTGESGDGLFPSQVGFIVYPFERLGGGSGAERP